MKVDNTSQLTFNQNRNSVRVTTKDRYAVGSLWLVDMVHVPFGVSVVLHNFAFRILTALSYSVRYGLPGGRKHRTGRRVAK